MITLKLINRVTGQFQTKQVTESTFAQFLKDNLDNLNEEDFKDMKISGGRTDFTQNGIPFTLIVTIE